MNSICILRLSAIGDVTHVIPVVLSLQEQVPGIKITWIIGKLEAKLIGDLPGVEFIVFDKNRGASEYFRLWKLMRGRKFDILLHMQVAFRSNLASICIPAKTRIGYDRARSKDLHGIFINSRINAAEKQHVRDCLASFLEPMGLSAAPPRWNIPYSQDSDGFARKHLATTRKNLIISPCASHKLRNWQVEMYAKLADYAIQAYGMHVILVGSPSSFEIQYCRDIASAMHESPLNLCGRDTLKQLTALCAGADLVIAPDTGPAHIASAVGTDVLGLYAASNPHRSGPYNSLKWCVNRYPEALEQCTGKTVDQAKWGTKAEFEGAMNLIRFEDTKEMLDQWHKSHSDIG